jgi:glucosamine-6-phosphate deaminase
MLKSLEIEYPEISEKNIGNASIKIFQSKSLASGWLAHRIAMQITDSARKGNPCILGLATGSSPLHVYAGLIDLHRLHGLSFKNVITFNLDEYYPMPPESRQSYVHFMFEHFFDHIDIPRQNINIPDGSIEPDRIEDFCLNYENKIRSFGGVDIQILGIGRTGHIGFNEPGSGNTTTTRLVQLDPLTISDAASDFPSLEAVPKMAITMGVKTIFSAKKIFLMAWGQKKARIVKQALTGPVNSQLPASFLQNHPNVEFVLDAEAAIYL